MHQPTVPATPPHTPPGDGQTLPSSPRAVGHRTSRNIKLILRGSSGPEDSIDEGWACRSNGQCDFFPGLDLTQVKVLKSTPDFRLFKLTQRQTASRPDHELYWAEAKGCAVTIWSEFVTKVNRHPGTQEAPGAPRKIRLVIPNNENTNHNLRNDMINNARRVCCRPTGRIRALRLTNLVSMPSRGNEMSWQIRPQRCSPRLSSGSLPTV